MDKYFVNFKQAEHAANYLYQMLSEKPQLNKNIVYLIDVMLQKAILYSLKEDHHKALKISLEALDAAEKYNFPDRAYRSCWIIAIMYENGNSYDMCKKYLDKANELYRQYKLDSVYSIYCVRMSSYLIKVHQRDSATSMAYKALDYAMKYNNKREIRDANLLLGSLLVKKNYEEAIKYRYFAANQFLDIEDFSSASIQLSLVASTFLKNKKIENAFRHSDSALQISQMNHVAINPIIYRIRSELFEAIGNADSAFFYFKKFHESYITGQGAAQNAKIKQISEQYQNDKKEAIIKSKDQLILFIASLFAIIVVGTIILIKKNREIRKKSKTISQQVAELSKTLHQKQVLLSELQHRVKNNLQHVISILEIQKESVDFNNIDELIRGNQNRIHSMALLHKKLNVTDNVQEVNLKRYIAELAELVKESYDSYDKKINLQVNCTIGNISLEKALPLGLIIVELVSNSMKHAFKKRHVGIINIDFTREEKQNRNELSYSDNGIGFDFNKICDKGLGQEIIKGLIDQLGGSTESHCNNGFELIVYFK
ncbi:MAG: sensor histidine kinase [Bacteroidetes bacterium]|nr:sensor histidine kinase [Bacteroidota bacterium]